MADSVAAARAFGGGTAYDMDGLGGVARVPLVILPDIEEERAGTQQLVGVFCSDLGNLDGVGHPHHGNRGGPPTVRIETFEVGSGFGSGFGSMADTGRELGADGLRHRRVDPTSAPRALSGGATRNGHDLWRCHLGVGQP